MPPDADTLRQRKSAIADSDDDADAEPTMTAPITAEISFTLASIPSNCVAIDGVVYDLSSFDHPGGESIHIFGGNDVTIQYNMIHPYHTRKHLDKMKRIGKVMDYKPEYKFDTPFEREIKKEVFEIVRRGREFGTTGWFFRAFLYIAAYSYLQYLWITKGSSFWLAIIYGVTQAMIGMNVQHDANHGACSKQPWINNVLGLGADFIGGSKWLWMQQHWTHHAYTNHSERDPDAFGAEPFLLFHDYPAGHPARTWMHRLQALYYLPVLSGYWLSSVFNPEILDLRQRGTLNMGVRMDSDYTVQRRKYAIALRLYYIYVHAVLPFQQHGLTWTALGHILLLGASESLALAILFSLSHNFEQCDRNPTTEATKTGEPVCWFKSQVETSCTYGGFLAGCFTGGLNFQIEHHLFPRMSSAWYPYIAPTVRQVCAKHGVRYVYYPWVFQNFLSTLKYIHAAGTGSHHWKIMNNPLSGKE